MAKNILILSASLRAGSNSEALANAFADGARAAGHTVELVSLRGKNIAFCRGCLACQTLGRCVIDDDAVADGAAIEGTASRLLGPTGLAVINLFDDI